MAKDTDKMSAKGIITKTLPGTKFLVKLYTEDGEGNLIMNDNNAEIVCHPCGKMRISKIKLLVGDKVSLQIGLYDLTKGIIMWRF